MNWCLASGDLASVQMKPTFIAFLALCLFLVGCGTTPKGINQTSKVKIGTPIWEFQTAGEVFSSPAIEKTTTVGTVVGPL